MHLAGFIILLHTAVPHIHANMVNRAGMPTQQEQTTLPGWLIDLLNTDLGEGHLEQVTTEFDIQLDHEFSQADFLLPDFFLLFHGIAAIPSHEEDTAAPNPDAFSRSYSSPHLFSNGLRAPPVKA